MPTKKTKSPNTPVVQETPTAEETPVAPADPPPETPVHEPTEPTGSVDPPKKTKKRTKATDAAPDAAPAASAKKAKKPKKKSGYDLFRDDFLKRAKEAAGETKVAFGDLSKQCAAAWAALGDEGQKPFKDDAAAKYAEEHKDDPVKPKRALTPWQVFLADFRVTNKEKGYTAPEVFKYAGEAWKVLTVEDKAKWKPTLDDDAASSVA